MEYFVEFQYKAFQAEAGVGKKYVQHEVKSFDNLLTAVEYYKLELGSSNLIFQELRLLPASQMLPIVLQRDGEKWSGQQVQQYNDEQAEQYELKLEGCNV